MSIREHLRLTTIRDTLLVGFAALVSCLIIAGAIGWIAVRAGARELPGERAWVCRGGHVLPWRRSERRVGAVLGWVHPAVAVRARRQVVCRRGQDRGCCGRQDRWFARQW